MEGVRIATEPGCVVEQEEAEVDMVRQAELVDGVRLMDVVAEEEAVR